MLCWIYRVWPSKECVCCFCDPSVHLESRCSFHRFCVCMSEVISSFKSLIAGSQVSALLMLFLCVILHTMWPGSKSLQLQCILTFCILCLAAIRMICVNILLSVFMLVGSIV